MWDIVGQSHATKYLKCCIEQGRLAHAYMITGPGHIGKMTLAINLAQAVNCIYEEVPCGHCTSCIRISSGNNTDVQVLKRIEGAMEIGIDQIRQVSHDSSLKPYEGDYRVFIIDGAEYLSTEASNALLKILEEPPLNVLLILLASQMDILLPTIISRCQAIELHPLSFEVIEEQLKSRWDVGEEQARTLSRFCNGAIGWAISALSDIKIIEERERDMTRIIEICDATINERFAYAAELATLFGRDRGLTRVLIDLWSGWWRDLLLVKGGAASLIVNIDREDALNEMADCYSLVQIKSFIEDIINAIKQLSINANPRLVFEVLMLKLPSSGWERREEKGLHSSMSL